MHTMNIVTSYVIMASVGGLPFLGAAAVLAVLYYNGASPSNERSH